MNLKDLLEPKFEVHIVCNEKENYTKVLGNAPSLLTALSCFVETLKKNKINEDLIMYAVEQGLKDEKDIDKEFKELENKLMNKLFD